MISNPKPVAQHDFSQPAGLLTGELAGSLKVQPQSIRAQLCRTGSYFGIKPMRLPNDRLLWPLDSVQQLLNREPVERKRPTCPTKRAEVV